MIEKIKKLIKRIGNYLYVVAFRIGFGTAGFVASIKRKYFQSREFISYIEGVVVALLAFRAVAPNTLLPLILKLLLIVIAFEWYKDTFCITKLGIKLSEEMSKAFKERGDENNDE